MPSFQRTCETNSTMDTDLTIPRQKAREGYEEFQMPMIVWLSVKTVPTLDVRLRTEMSSVKLKGRRDHVDGRSQGKLDTGMRDAKQASGGMETCTHCVDLSRRGGTRFNQCCGVQCYYLWRARTWLMRWTTRGQVRVRRQTSRRGGCLMARGNSTASNITNYKDKKLLFYSTDPS